MLSLFVSDSMPHNNYTSERKLATGERSSLLLELHDSSTDWKHSDTRVSQVHRQIKSDTGQGSAMGAGQVSSLPTARAPSEVEAARNIHGKVWKTKGMDFRCLTFMAASNAPEMYSTYKMFHLVQDPDTDMK